MPSAIPWSPVVAEPGVQPEADGRLQCLECGRWYRQLGQHVVAIHEMSADDYRRSHELPAGRGLHASDLLESRAARGRANFEADPEGYLAHRLTPKHTTIEERVEMARAARAESLARAGVQAAAREVGSLAGRAARRRVDVPFERRARELGYAGVVELLEANAEVPNRPLGELLGVTEVQARKLRIRFDFRSPGRWDGHVPTSSAHRPRLAAEELAAIPLGEQPVRGEEVLCRECGRWYRVRGHPQHLATVHAMTVEHYRVRYGLDPVDLRARELGHDGIEALLAATADLDGLSFAELVGIDQRAARVLRHRHGYPSPRRRVGPARLSEDELSTFADGDQPERQGKMLCRECGGWFRGLAQHLGNKHHVSPADYRERYGLAIGASLQATELRERRQIAGRQRWDDDPEWRERFVAAGLNLADDAQRALAMQGRRRSQQRPGGRAHLLAAGDRLARVLPQRTQEEYERRAEELGYASVPEMLAATKDLTGSALGQLLGVASRRAYALRARHGVSSPGPTARRTPAELAAAKDDAPPGPGWMHCLECGRWSEFLGKHVSKSHGLRPAEYRTRHGLAPDAPLHPLTEPRAPVDAPIGVKPR